ncbi:hypothetical protein [Hyphomicrobium sp.]|uniref:hypothetical protein n=1 Tax=Hyphomicrobium sp. TaxID=82 RepID=UPI0035688D83
MKSKLGREAFPSRSKKSDLSPGVQFEDRDDEFTSTIDRAEPDFSSITQTAYSAKRQSMAYERGRKALVNEMAVAAV